MNLHWPFHRPKPIPSNHPTRSVDGRFDLSPRTQRQLENKARVEAELRAFVVEQQLVAAVARAVNVDAF